MGKFLLIRCPSMGHTETKSFEKKYTASKLKKVFKCESIIELSRLQEPQIEAKKISKISTDVLRQITRQFLATDYEDSAFDDEYRAKKLFILSDDAEISAMSFHVMTDDVRIEYFEISQKTCEELIETIEQISQNNYTKQEANEAKDLYESLQNLQYSLEINLVSRYGDDELDEKIDDCDTEIQTCREKVAELISEKWKPAIKPKTIPKKRIVKKTDA